MSLLTDLEKMDTDLKQVRTDTNVALVEKGGTEVQNLNEIAEAVRGLPSGSEDVLKYATKEESLFENAQFPANYELVVNASNTTNIRRIIYNSSGVKKISFTGINKSKVYNTGEVVGFSKDLEVVDFGVEQIKFGSGWRCFNGSEKLTTILGALDLSPLDKSFEGLVWNPSLKEVRFVKNSISFSTRIIGSNLLSPASIQSIIDGLATVTTPQTLTLHKNIVLSAEQKETIRTKGWTLAQ